jgi:hypothetical protein
MENKLSALRLGMFSDPSANQTRTCATKGCPETTREGKIYCTNHVEKHPYVKHLLDRMADRDKEDHNVKMRGPKAVNMEGITVAEIMLHLRQNGPRTEERLQRELQIDKSIIHNYVVALNQRGLVKFDVTSRYSLTVELVEHSSDDLIEDAED